jgi:hypothetical protein
VGEGIREEKLPNELYKRKEEPTFSWGKNHYNFEE